MTQLEQIIGSLKAKVQHMENVAIEATEESEGHSDGVDAVIEDAKAEIAQIHTEAISTYTIDQATEDGVLFDFRQLNPQWERGIFSHATVNLLVSHGYLVDGDPNIPNLIDLLNQSLEIVRRESKNISREGSFFNGTMNISREDSFFSGTIELPSGKQQKLFMCLNELNKFTIMLPEDY